MDAFLKTGKLGSGASSSTADSMAKDKDKAGAASSSEGAGLPSSFGARRTRGPTPWVEKYRPRTVTDVAHQDEVVAVLKTALTGADLPNLLFYGPPGTGKTSTILAAARDLFGPELYRHRILELNASDERGIAVVRDKVKRFSQLTASGRRSDGTPCPPYKIVILDEADSMTRDAQSALRRTMEKEGRSTKFCLICNYVSRIIEPLTSRCAKFRFKPLDKAVLIGRLQLIADAESLQVEPAAMDAFLETSEGDLRKAITSMQSCARLKSGGSLDEGAISASDVYEMSGVVPSEWLDRLFQVCGRNSFEKVQAFADEMMCEGFSVTQTLAQIHSRVVDSPDLSDRQKSCICESLAVSEHRLLDGANEYLQLMDTAAVIMKTIAEGA